MHRLSGTDLRSDDRGGAVGMSALGSDAVGVLVGERLVRVQAAVARARQRRVRAAAAVAEDRGAAAAGLLLLVARVLLFLGELGFGADVHPPAGEAGGQTRVLALGGGGPA